MKTLLILLTTIFAIAVGLFGAVDGTVVNGTTSQPQASVVITFLQPGAQDRSRRTAHDPA
jgi:hypothetical protein